MIRGLTFVLLSFCALQLFAATGDVEKGDKYMKSYQYDKAAAMYKQAVDANGNDTAAWQRLGLAFLNMGDITSAEAIYKTLASNPLASHLNKFYYAQILRMNARYREADAAYKEFARAVPNDPRAAAFKNFYEDVKPLTIDSKTFELATWPENSFGSDIGPGYCAGKLVFASNRDNDEALRMVDHWNGTGYYDLYYEHGAGAVDSVTPERIKGDVSGKFDEGPATFSRDGKEMIFTRTNYDDPAPDGTRKLGLYHATMDPDKKKWVNVKPLSFSKPAYNFCHPALSKDGTHLYFVSDMPNGFGETDIYMVAKNGSSWDQPVNLGKEINTMGLEGYPFIADDGTLYFASDSRMGLGGLDIYSAKLAHGNWANVVNMGAPVNSRVNDFGFVTDETGRSGYFVSSRDGGQGSDDIYKFTRLAETWCGTVTDAKTQKPLDNAVVTTYSLSTGDQLRNYTNTKGEFCISVESGKTYELEAGKEGYAGYKGTISLQGLENQPKKIALEPRGGIDFTLNVSEQGGENLTGATAFLINKNTSEVTQAKSDPLGRIKFDLYKDQEYEVKVTAKNSDRVGAYDNFVKTVSTMGLSPGQKLKEDVKLTFHDVLSLGLPTVYFDNSSSEIKPQAAKELDKVVSIMKTYPDIQIELAAHSDSRGAVESDMTMSGKRAQACVTYLQGKGVDITHLIAIGYGTTKPSHLCSKSIPCTEKDHASNRRVVFTLAKLEE